jgi:very-short-patch-repair endonuclease
MDAPISLIKERLERELLILTESLPILIQAQAPSSATVRQLSHAAASRLSLIAIKNDIVSNFSLAEDLEGHWRGCDTATDPLIEALEWLSKLRDCGLPAEFVQWVVSGSERPIALATTARAVGSFLSALNSAFDELARWGSSRSEEWLTHIGANPTIAEIGRACEACVSSEPFLSSWFEFCRVSSRLQDLGHRQLIEFVKASDQVDRPAALLRAHAFEAIVREAIQNNPELSAFTRPGYEQAITGFRNLDNEIRALRSQQIARIAARAPIPAGNGSGPVRTFTERHLLEHELGKKRRHIPIRQLVQRAAGALRAIKPCFMMSPMSVAQYLPPGRVSFDLVVMDEASQVKPEDALGGILRGEKIVIVGDPKQLPPTTFFDRIADDDDQDEDRTAAEETESILEIAQRVFPNRMLTWHYRSRHPSLISFSNAHFYNNSLLVFPSPIGSGSNLGVKSHFIEGAAYKNSRNLLEARFVAEAARAHLLEHQNDSLGIAAMNSQQRDLIASEIERLQKTDLRFDEVLRAQDEMEEPFFVKNLENVQGDEREVIFVSTTYGPDPDTQHVYQRFGPISGSHGWRRLNVLFTRARRRIELFTSLRSSDILVGESSSRGVAALRNYLEFAESGRIPDVGNPTGRPPDSDFEIDVARLLAMHGYQVDAQVGVAGFFIDIAVKDPRGSNAYTIGVECDGASYHSAKSIRDRDRLRQEILEAKGWRIHRIWSADWFKNRDLEIDRLLAAVEDSVRVIGAR